MVAYSPEMIALLQRLEGVFMPEVGRQREAMRSRSDGPLRFAHYTSADAALKIIASKRLWMRNTTAMIDYSEVLHGNNILGRVVDKDRLKRLSEALNLCVPGAANRAIAKFKALWGNIQSGTYVACLSEHDVSEDTHGRLSMWRAFNRGGARVALIMRLPEHTTAAATLNLIFSPVSYLTEANVARVLDEVIANITREAAFLRTIQPAQVEGMAFLVLAAAAMCLKHEGFGEEREWRAIYAPWLAVSPHMKAITDSIDGVPQTIYPLPLDEAVSPDIAAIDLARIFDRLIIGPTQYGAVMAEAFVTALTTLGIKDAANKTFISGIPIRS